MPADTIDVPIAESHLMLEERIRSRAYEIYERRKSRGSGEKDAALDDWLQAEREILGDSPKNSAEDRATVIGHAGRPGIVL
jgi:hypothetical protein